MCQNLIIVLTPGGTSIENFPPVDLTIGIFRKKKKCLPNRSWILERESADVFDDDDSFKLKVDESVGKV